MTESEVQRAIMNICKVATNDSDFNVVGFYLLCDKLKQIGATEEREACAKLMDEMAAQDNLTNYYKVAARAIRERSQE
jgi:hypothetical protein